MIKKGFTLIELLVVIAILGIIVYITSFNNNIDTYLTLQNEFSTIKDDIAYIQKESIRNNKKHKIILYNNQNYYDVETVDKNQNKIIEKIPLTSKLFLKNQSNFYHVIEFTKTGTLSRGAGTFNLEYKNKKYEFTVLFSTGFVNTTYE